jgi:pimeloyl-ACP methyl ester carboxylesterase
MPHLTTSPTGDKPTVVLVHGAFAESSSWNGVIDRLLADGFPVVAAANPLRGVWEDSAYLAETYGGAVIGQAAKGNDRVAALVFIAAYALDVGETVASIGAGYEGGTLGETLVAFDLPGGQKGPLHRPGPVPRAVLRRRPRGSGGAHGRHPSARSSRRR